MKEFLEDFGVDSKVMEEAYEGNSEKLIPKDWYVPIIKDCIERSGNNIENVNINKNQRTLIITFDDESSASKSEEAFHKNVMKSTNSHIRKNDEVPKAYNRALILETKLDGRSLTINY